MFVGVGASQFVICSKTRKRMPFYHFYYEIDAVGRQRGAGMGGGQR